MGSAFGHQPDNGFNFYFYPDVTPGPLEEPTFDPLLGFEDGRKTREMIATDEQLRSAKVEPKDRDYCAHYLLDFRACRKANFPWVVNCHHEKHAFLNCKYDDFLIRAKEYERERRLRVKAKKARCAKANKEAQSIES